MVYIDVAYGRIIEMTFQSASFVARLVFEGVGAPGDNGLVLCSHHLPNHLAG